VTSGHEGYEQIFRDCPGLYWAHDERTMLDMITWLLSRSDDVLRAQGDAARQWVADNLEADKVFAQAFALCVDAHRRRAPAAGMSVEESRQSWTQA
jgi:hypothetical protein